MSLGLRNMVRIVPKGGTTHRSPLLAKPRTTTPQVKANCNPAPGHLTPGPKSVKMSIVDKERNSRESLSRREALRLISGAWVGAPILKSEILPILSASKQQPNLPSVPPSTQTPLSPEDDLFLEELERATVAYFWEQANPQTGLVKDRCNVRAADNTCGGEYCGDRLRTDGSLHRGEAQVHSLF